MTSTSTTASATTVTVGIDLGCENCKVVVLSTTSRSSSKSVPVCEIVRSDSGNHVTPTTVAFCNRLRLTGEEATSVQKGGNKNCIIHLNRLLQLQSSNDRSDTDNSDDGKNVDLLQEFYQFDYVTIREEKEQQDGQESAEVMMVTVDYNGKLQAFSAAALLAQFLSKIQASVHATMHRISSSSTGNDHCGATSSAAGDYQYRYVFAVPPATTLFACQQIVHAAHAAGLVSTLDDDAANENAQNVICVHSSVAYCQTYQRKFPPTTSTTTTASDDATETAAASSSSRNRHVLIIDMGHAQTTVTVLECSSSSSSSVEQKDNHAGFEVLVSNSDDNLGAGCIDVRLWRYFQSSNKLLLAVQPKSRAGYRLLEACRNLKHLLSQLPDGGVTVENICDDVDVQLTMSRAQLAELCQPEVQRLQHLIQMTLQQAASSNKNNNKDTEETPKVINITAVEVVGGGCRIPCVQAAILASLPPGNNKDVTLSRSLDDTSSALGAALVGEQLSGGAAATAADYATIQLPSTENDESTACRKQQLRQAELTMQALDDEQKAVADIRNLVESRVLELRSARHSNTKHGSLLPDQALTEYLNELDDWLFSEDANENATLDNMQAKWQETQAKLQDMCADFNAAVEQDKAMMEKEMNDAAKQAAAEKACNGSNADANDDDDDDHDNRRLPKKRRMEIVMKNKEEANELFKDGNYKFAAARYTKALTHCSKFVDLNPDDATEVKNIKVTLNLNLALAYCKLENYDQALRVCNDALSLDKVNVKALYRRSSVYFEKKKWDEAKQDIQKAMQLMAAAAEGTGATEDKAFKKLSDRIDAQLKKQIDKEKKMAAKMFG
jgi:molecular chaperone DnaK (HSP70)